MIDVFSFTLGVAVGATATFIFAWETIRTYKSLYEISERRCNRFYDRLLDKESQE